MSAVIERSKLHPQFPTHRHDAALWEQLGRTVAAFDFLEDVLAKAFLAFSGMREVKEEDVPQALENWGKQLESAARKHCGGSLRPMAAK